MLTLLPAEQSIAAQPAPSHQLTVPSAAFLPLFPVVKSHSLRQECVLSCISPGAQIKCRQELQSFPITFTLQLFVAP